MNANTPLNSQLKDADLVLNRPRNTIRFFLGRVSAVFCALFILLLGVLCISSWVDGMRNTLLPGKSGGYIAGVVTVNLIFLLLTLQCGVAFGRFLLRVVPPQLSGRVRLGPILLTFPMTIVCAFISATLILLLGSTSSGSQHASGSPLIIASFVLGHLTWWGAVASSLIAQHLKPCAFLDGRFVLFLRRFSKFSDRVVINLILSQTPPDTPVVFLTPTRSRAADWNPFLIGFAGMQFRHPFRGVPITLRSPDDEWKQVAELLIRRAQLIVFDISEGSSAIETEFEMISQAARWSNVICLKEGAATADSEFEQTIRFKGVQVIEYRKSWIRALPRLILGFFAISFYAALVPRGLLELLLWAWLYYSFFVRPAVDGAAKTSLRMELWAYRKSNIL